jgi:hypothetical protein
MAIDKKLIDQLLTNYKKPADIIGENGLLKELTKKSGQQRQAECFVYACTQDEDNILAHLVIRGRRWACGSWQSSSCSRTTRSPSKRAAVT